ncbi:MAG: LAGLIDADG family homing endonuclease [Candidatus Micrarchaeota archaeon]
MVQTTYGAISDSELQEPVFSRLPSVPLPVLHENCPTELNPELAYFVGYFFGDGGLKDVEKSFQKTDHREYKLIIADEFELQMKLIQRLYGRLFGVIPPIRYERIEKGERTLYINPTSKRVYLFLTTVFELPKGSKTSDLHIPKVIWFAPRELQAWFLRGLFDADGDTRAVEAGFRSAPRVKLRMKCISFVQEVKMLFEQVFNMHVNGPYFDKNNASAYIQIERFSDICELSKNVLFLHPIKRWRLTKTADFLLLKSNAL